MASINISDLTPTGSKLFFDIEQISQESQHIFGGEGGEELIYGPDETARMRRERKQNLADALFAFERDNPLRYI